MVSHKSKSSVGTDGLSSADEYKIRIPCSLCNDWLPPEDYRDLTDPGNKWTVQNGDLFIVGEWTGGNVSGIAELKRISSEWLEQYSATPKIFTDHQNIYGSEVDLDGNKNKVGDGSG